MQVIKTNPLADMGYLTRGLNDRERSILQRSVDSTYQEFLSVVSEGRGIPVDSVRTIAEGRVWTGSQALQNGLVDTLGGIRTAIAIAARRAELGVDDYRLRILPRKLSLFESLEQFMSTAISSAFSDPVTRLDPERIEAFVNKYSGLQARMIDLNVK
jgi:protease-4